MRQRGHLQSREYGVRIEFEVPEHLVLLSSFDGWHAVLNNHCLALNDAEYIAYEQLEKVSAKDEFETIKKRSWLKIFDLSLLPDPNSYEIQAVLWEIKIEWVKKVDFFIAC